MSRDFEALAGVFRIPAAIVARPYLESIQVDHPYSTVRVKGIERPLRWPSQYPLRDLYKVIAECFDSANWHYYEAPETAVESGMVVLDCGAAEGVFSLRIEDRAGKVFAFEPYETYIRSLGATFQGSDVVEIVPRALGRQAGRASMRGERYWATLVPGPGDVEVTSIDEWAGAQQIDYIKADVEGFEHALLEGARETIFRCRPRIAITTYHPGNDAQWMVEFLRRLSPRYRCRTKGTSYSKGVRRPVMLHAWWV